MEEKIVPNTFCCFIVQYCANCRNLFEVHDNCIEFLSLLLQKENLLPSKFTRHASALKW